VTGYSYRVRRTEDSKVLSSAPATLRYYPSRRMIGGSRLLLTAVVALTEIPSRMESIHSGWRPSRLHLDVKVELTSADKGMRTFGAEAGLSETSS